MMRSRHKYLFLFFVTVTCVALAVPAGATVTKRLYINGNLMGSNAVPGQLAYTYDRITLACEGNQWYMYNALQGGLDEFAIYEGVLDPCTVKDHYDAAQVNEPNYVAEIRSDNPQIYLRLDDPNSFNGSPAVCDPCSAVQRNGTYINTVTQGTGIFGGPDTGAFFAGDLPDANFMGCIDIWDGDRVFSFEEVSVEVWVNSKHLYDNYPRLFQHNGNWTNENAYGVMCNDSNGPNNPGGETAGVIGAGETSYFPTGDINDGNWNHVVVTYEFTYEPNGYETEVNKDSPLIYFRFEQDDIAHDVNVINNGSKTVAARFLGGPTPQPRYAPGVAGKGVFLNDETTNVVIIDSPNFKTGGVDNDHIYALTPGDMTVEVWFRSRPLPEYSGTDLNWARMFSNNGTWTVNQSGRVMLMPSGYGMFGGGGSGTPSGMWMDHPGWNPQADPNWATGPADGYWHHVVATFDVNDTGGHDPNIDPPTALQFYLDGALLNTALHDVNATLSMDGILGPEFREFLIGCEASSGNRYNCFRGVLDEFALYDHILSPERIYIHFQEGLAAAPWMPQNCDQIYLMGWEMPADLNHDCKVNFNDMVVIADDWWRCMRYGYPKAPQPGTGGDPTCEHPWW